MEVEERKLNILLVENSAVIAKQIIRILDNMPLNNDVLYTLSAEKAYNLISSKKIDIVVWGVQYNAFTAAHLSEFRKQGKKFPLVVLSEFCEEDYKKRYNYINADFFIDKQKNLSKLATLIQELHPENF